MKPDIVALVDGRSPIYFHIGDFARGKALYASLVWDKELVNDQGARVVLIFHQHFSFGAAEVINCSRSVDGPELSAWVNEEMHRITPTPEVRYSETDDTPLKEFHPPGLEIFLMGHIAADLDILQGIIAGCKKYISKGK